MSLLIINTLPEDDEEAIEAIKKLSEKSSNVKVINTCNLNIMHCTGCKSCMFQNPGICCLKDDYNTIAKLYLEYNDIVFLSDTSLNFLNHKTMRLFERSFSFAVVYCEFRDNSIRHIMRYNHKTRWGILYKGYLNKDLLNEWLSLYTEHFDETSLGAFSIDSIEEIYKCM